jgi:SAM-dependent methyltransferase
MTYDNCEKREYPNSIWRFVYKKYWTHKLYGLYNVCFSCAKILLPSLSTSLDRWIVSSRYDKNKFVLKNSSNPFQEIYKSNLWRAKQSVSGEGSELDATITIREKLPLLIDNLSIRSILDAPCGDYNWMKEVPKKCEYIGTDIIAEIVEKNNALYGANNIRFIQSDITKDPIPKVDLIFCKDCLQHLSFKKIADIINNFKNSDSTYLLVTSYPWTWVNYDIFDGDYRPLNLQKSPFFFPKPILKIKEKSKMQGVEPDKTMYLYKLSSIPFINYK